VSLREGSRRETKEDTNELMKLNRNNSGFTLIELMIVVAIIAIIASIAIPKLMSARISANENAAVATLRSLASAQSQIQSASAIDTDADGGGEYAFFGELAGVANLRAFDPTPPGGQLGSNDSLVPPILPTAFGAIVDDGNDGVVERSGYYFKIFLPGPGGGGAADPIPAVTEDKTANVGGTVANFPDPDNTEILWSAYAWPVEAGSTGNRCFYINQEGDLLQTVNTGVNAAGPFYDGFATIPAFDAALSDESPADMSARLGITAMLINDPNGPFAANDGNVWSVVGN